MENSITTAQALARALSQAGVKRMFGLPGGGSSLDVIEAAAQLGIDFVLTKSENAAVMMAGAMAETKWCKWRGLRIAGSCARSCDHRWFHAQAIGLHHPPSVRSKGDVGARGQRFQSP